MKFTAVEKDVVQEVRFEQLRLLYRAFFGEKPQLDDTPGKLAKALSRKIGNGESVTIVNLSNATTAHVSLSDGTWNPKQNIIQTIKEQLPDTQILRQRLGSDFDNFHLELFGKTAIEQLLDARLGKARNSTSSQPKLIKKEKAPRKARKTRDNDLNDQDFDSNLPKESHPTLTSSFENKFSNQVISVKQLVGLGLTPLEARFGSKSCIINVGILNSTLTSFKQTYEIDNNKGNLLCITLSYSPSEVTETNETARDLSHLYERDMFTIFHHDKRGAMPILAFNANVNFVDANNNGSDTVVLRFKEL